MGNDTTWSLSEVRCKEEGCPPVEVVLIDLSVKGPKPGNGVYKIFKAMAEVTKEDVEACLKMGSAAACQAGGQCGASPPAEAAGHGGGSCCDGHGDGHGKAHGGHGDGHGDAHTAEG